MPEISANRLMNFDYGISDIVFTQRDEEAAHSLPERRDLPPSDGNVRAQLSELLEKPNTARFLEEALRPAIDDRDLLSPTRFSDALQDALTELTTLARSDNADSRVLNRAARLLKEETNLRELVVMYRSALYQG